MANQLWDQLQDYLQCMTSKPIVIGYSSGSVVLQSYLLERPTENILGAYLFAASSYLDKPQFFRFFAVWTAATRTHVAEAMLCPAVFGGSAPARREHRPTPDLRVLANPAGNTVRRLTCACWRTPLGTPSDA